MTAPAAESRAGRYAQNFWIGALAATFGVDAGGLVDPGSLWGC
jgi:hypothetical protein